MGSGGMIVMDETSSHGGCGALLHGILHDESCGKCIPCRAGTVQMHEMLGRITRARARPADLPMLEELCGLLRNTSLCGLGQSAPNPVLSTLRYFPSRVSRRMIREHRCPAGHCRMREQRTGTA